MPVRERQTVTSAYPATTIQVSIGPTKNGDAIFVVCDVHVTVTDDRGNVYTVIETDNKDDFGYLAGFVLEAPHTRITCAGSVDRLKTVTAWIETNLLNVNRIPPIVVEGAIAVLRGWRNDGADGESAHLVCDALEQEQKRTKALRVEIEKIRLAARSAGHRPTSVLDKIEKIAEEALR